MGKKKWYLSRTLWLNFIGAVAFFVQAQTGYVIDPIIQAQILAGLNFLLRIVTKEEITT